MSQFLRGKCDNYDNYDWIGKTYNNRNESLPIYRWDRQKGNSINPVYIYSFCHLHINVRWSFFSVFIYTMLYLVQTDCKFAWNLCSDLCAAHTTLLHYYQVVHRPTFLYTMYDCFMLKTFKMYRQGFSSLAPNANIGN